LMLDGTVKYLGEVLGEYRNGLRSAGIINDPIKPRVLLRKYSQGDKSHNKGSLAMAG
jgi:hypothetical protein